MNTSTKLLIATWIFLSLLIGGGIGYILGVNKVGVTQTIQPVQNQFYPPQQPLSPQEQKPGLNQQQEGFQQQNPPGNNQPIQPIQR